MKAARVVSTGKLTALCFAMALAGLFFVPRAALALQCHVGTIDYHPQGGIKSCQIEGNHQFWTAQGAALVCRSGYVVTQYPDGEKESCTIAKPYSAGGARCEVSSRLELDRDGNIRKCE